MQSVLVRLAGDGDENWLHSIVVDFTPHRRIVALLPGSGARKLIPHFEEGQQIEVQLPLPDGVRCFVSRLLRVDTAYNRLQLTWPAEGTRVQRRNHVRVGHEHAVTASFRESGETCLLEGSTIDLSAGGVRLLLASPIPDETRIELELPSLPAAARKLVGRVVRSGLMAEADQTAGFWVAVEFVDLDHAARREITQYIFDVQCEQRRKRLV